MSACCSSFDLKLHPSVYPYGFFYQYSDDSLQSLLAIPSVAELHEVWDFLSVNSQVFYSLLLCMKNVSLTVQKRCVLYWLMWGQLFKGVFECRASTKNATSLKIDILFCGGYKFLGLLSFDMLKDWCFYACGHFAVLKIMLIGTL